MIYDSIENLNIYKGLSKHIRNAIEYVQHNNLRALEPGKYEIDGDEVFLNISEYETHSEESSLFETHEIYVDLQVLLSGSEQIYCLPRDKAGTSRGYQLGNDITFYEEGSHDWVSVEIDEKRFCILYPQDAHKPGIQTGEAGERVRKAVIKIKIT